MKKKALGDRKRTSIRREGGFSLVEAIVATVVLTIATGAIFALLYRGQYAFQAQEDMLRTTRQARIAMDQICRYLRQAGSDPFEVGFPPVEVLGPGDIRINSDVTGSVPSSSDDPRERKGDPDGNLDSIFERVRISHHEDQIHIDIGYGTEVLVDNVPTLNLTFYDRNGNLTTDDHAIARISVELVARTSMRDPETGRVNSITLTSDVFLRRFTYNPFGGL